jgi:replication factor A1
LLFQDRFWQTKKKRGLVLKQKKTTINEQLATLSVRYDVYPAELFNALVAAKESEKSTAGELSVEYRGSINNEAIFLIKKNGSIVVQFRVEEELLSRKDIHFDNWMNTDKVRKQIARQTPSELTVSLIKDLRVGMRKVNVDAQVLEVPKPQTVYTQFGNRALLSNAIISDESGKIKLSLWDQQINTISVGDSIQIRNASVAAFKGEPQLRLGKTATLNVTQKTPSPNSTKPPKNEDTDKTKSTDKIVMA